jgi:hypothetical protein
MADRTAATTKTSDIVRSLSGHEHGPLIGLASKQLGDLTLPDQEMRARHKPPPFVDRSRRSGHRVAQVPYPAARYAGADKEETE